jgi:hypothetical protein
VLFWSLDPGSGMGKNKDRDQDPGSGINIPDHNSQRLVTIFLGVEILKFFVADQDPGSGNF